MEYGIKITGSGTRQELLIALNAVMHNLLTFPDSALQDATWEDPTLCTLLSTYDEDEDQDGRNYNYQVDLDERGEYKATVYDDCDNEIWDIADIQELNQLIEDGYMKHKQDMDGLCSYLTKLGVFVADSQLRYHG